MDGTRQDTNTEPAAQLRPGETISPRAEAAPPTPLSLTTVEPASSAPPPSPAAPAQPQIVTSEPAAAQTTPPAPTPTPTPTPEAFNPQPPEETSWQNEPTDGITWTASEYVAHGKTAGWHTLLIGGAILLAAVVWFISKDIVSPIVIAVAGIVLSMYGRRQPKEVQYQLDDHGIAIGRRQFGFGEFKAFSVEEETDAFDSIALIPMKRFLPLTTLYFDPADEEHILNIIASHLPHMERKTDAIDALMRRLRF
jgi:hypothetical protein